MIDQGARKIGSLRMTNIGDFKKLPSCSLPPDADIALPAEPTALALTSFLTFPLDSNSFALLL